MPAPAERLAPAATVVVVAWRSPFVPVCLETLSEAEVEAPFEVVVVANGTDECFAADKVVRSPINLGFPAAANRGAAAGSAKFIVFLHDDAEVGPGWLDLLLAPARAGAEVVVPKTQGPEGDHDVSSCGLLVSRSVFEEIGGFDEGFFPGWFEAAHLIRRVRSVGRAVVWQPDVPIAVHDYAGLPADLQAHVIERNRVRLDALWSTPEDFEGTVEEPDAGAGVDADWLNVTGWGLHRDGPLDGVVLFFGDQPVGTARLGHARPDVAAGRPAVPGARAAGWTSQVDLIGARGEVQLRVLGGRDGTWSELGRREIRVTRRRGARRKVAAFTIVQNEPDFLPVWLRYYSRELGADDLYVLDHDSTDGSTSAVRDAHVVPVHRTESFDHRWLRATVEDFQRFLLRSYDAVVFAEVDELLVVDPDRAASLRDYIGEMDGMAARATGWNVVQHDGESPWDPERPVLEQRRWWHRAPTYDKVLVTTVPLNYEIGFHEQRSIPNLEPDHGLLLLHLHRVDRMRCLARHRNAASRTWSRTDLELGGGFQNRIVMEEEFECWFVSGDDLGDPEPQPVPTHLRSLV